jgi:DNA-binding NarL/FixJ family response regulator
METAKQTHVFLVDDSVAIRLRLAEMLNGMEGVDIVGEAGDVRGAVDGILRLQPHSVVLDLNLMGSTGIEVMRQVHPRAPQVVFVVLTNHAEAQNRQACARAGASYFLDKSCDFERVPQVIAEIAAARP